MRSFHERNQDKAYILYLIKVSEKIRSNLKMVKIIFLVNYEFNQLHNDTIFNYKFKQWHFGPYNDWIKWDLSDLLNVRLISMEDRNYVLTEVGKRKTENFARILNPEKLEFITKIIEKYSDKTGEELMRFVNDLESIKKTKFSSEILF